MYKKLEELIIKVALELSMLVDPKREDYSTFAVIRSLDQTFV